MRTLVAVFAVFALVASAGAEFQYNFNVAGVNSWDLLYDADNEIYTPNLAVAAGLPAGTALEMIGIGWDVTIATVGASWLNEARTYFDDTINPDGTGLFVTPGSAVGAPGTQAFSSGGILYLADYGIAPIPLPNGLIRMEFYESYEDYANAIDANWLSGSYTIVYTPEPGSLALLALGGLALIRRR